jgi:hypothetical protein
MAVFASCRLIMFSNTQKKVLKEYFYGHISRFWLLAQ